MVKKAVLARFILQGDHELSEWRNFLPKITGLRVKGVGSQGAVLISLDASGWFSPEDWLVNYQQQTRERLNQELKTAEAVLPPDQMEALILQLVKSQTKPNLTENDKEYILSIIHQSELSRTQRLVNVFLYCMEKFNDGVFARQVVEMIKSLP